MDYTSPRPEKQNKVSNLTIAVILALAAGAVTGAYFLSRQSPGLGSNEVATTEPKLSLANVQEFDAFIRTQMAKSSAQLAVINIWATWCEPCRTEMPELAKFQELYPNWPLFLMSADNENDLEAVRKFLRDSNVKTASHLLRSEQSEFIETWQKRSHVDVNKQWSMSLPVTFFIDQNGKVLKFISSGTTKQELVAIAEGLERELPAAKPQGPDAL